MHEGGTARGPSLRPRSSSPAPPSWGSDEPLSQHRAEFVRSDIRPRGTSTEVYGTTSQPFGNRVAYATGGRPPQRMVRADRSALDGAVTREGPDDVQNKRRRIQRQFTKPYLAEMASAHAERRSPVVHVPTTTTGKPIGLRSAWHRQVRLFARQSMDQSIRSYRGKKGAWWKAVEKIYAMLEEIFTYDYPLCATYLSKYLKGAVKNDRLEWKDYFITTHGGQHDKCPDKAFSILRKYWLSVAGKEESEQMTALRSLGPQKSCSYGSQGIDSTCSPHTQVFFNMYSRM